MIIDRLSKTDFSYDFKIDVRASSIHNKTYSSFLTFLGARLKKSGIVKADGSDGRAEFSGKMRLPGDTSRYLEQRCLVSENSLADKSGQDVISKPDGNTLDHIPFSSCSSGCGCIEIGVWQAGCILDSTGKHDVYLIRVQRNIFHASYPNGSYV